MMDGWMDTFIIGKISKFTHNEDMALAYIKSRMHMLCDRQHIFRDSEKDVIVVAAWCFSERWKLHYQGGSADSVKASSRGSPHLVSQRECSRCNARTERV